VKVSFLRAVAVRVFLGVSIMEKVVSRSIILPAEKAPFGIQRIMLAITIGRCKGRTAE
jgi:hypothetical protein